MEAIVGSVLGTMSDSQVVSTMAMLLDTYERVILTKPDKQAILAALLAETREAFAEFIAAGWDPAEAGAVLVLASAFDPRRGNDLDYMVISYLAARDVLREHRD